MFNLIFDKHGLISMSYFSVAHAKKAKSVSDNRLEHAPQKGAKKEGNPKCDAFLLICSPIYLEKSYMGLPKKGK